MVFTRHRFVAFAIFALVPLASLRAAGEETASAPITRAQAAELARARHIEVRVAHQELAAARARRLQADGFAPIDLLYDFEESENGNPAQAGNRRYGVEQSFDWPGKRLHRKRAADARVELALAALRRAEMRATAKALKAFEEALLARANESLLMQGVNRMEEAVTLSRIRFQGGQGQYLDVLRTQTAYQRLRGEQRAAMLAVRRAERALAAAIGANQVSTLTGELALDAPPPADAFLARWQDESPTRVLLAARDREAEAVTAATRSGRFPDMAIGVQRQQLGTAGVTTNAWAGGIRLSIPLPGSDFQRGLEAAARAEEARARDTATAMTANIDKQIRQRLDEADGLFAQARDYRDAVLPNAEDQLKAAQQEYRVRRIDALNLLDVYNTYLNTQRDYLESLTRYRSALIDIETLGEDLWEITE